MYDYGNEVNELVDEGYDYDDAVALCEFIMGEDVVPTTPATPNERGCTVCRHPAKWFHIFRAEFPYVSVNPQFFDNGKVKSVSCPFCGKSL